MLAYFLLHIQLGLRSQTPTYMHTLFLPYAMTIADIANDVPRHFTEGHAALPTHVGIWPFANKTII